MLDSFTDEIWASVTQYLQPGCDPTSVEAIGFRKRISEVQYAVAAQYTSKIKPGKTFSEFAEAGEVFLLGLERSFQFLQWVDGVLNEGQHPARFDRLPAEEKHLIERLIHRLRLIDDMIINAPTIADDEDCEAPNSKRWLHEGVSRLYVIWLDAGQSHRMKKDFLHFAYTLIHPFAEGVTENSILESFDRHAKREALAWIEFRAKLRRQTSAK